jgi:hypothetical protein
LRIYYVAQTGKHFINSLQDPWQSTVVDIILISIFLMREMRLSVLNNFVHTVSQLILIEFQNFSDWASHIHLTLLWLFIRKMWAMLLPWKFFWMHQINWYGLEISEQFFNIGVLCMYCPAPSNLSKSVDTKWIKIVKQNGRDWRLKY